MELIPGKLYFTLKISLSELLINHDNDSVINLDDLYQHTKIRKHFGPPSLKIIWKHCEEVDARLKKYRRVIFFTNNESDNLHIEQRTLSSFLMASYGVLILHLDADKVNKVLLNSVPARLAFFRDYHGDSSYKLNIRDCLQGLQTGCLTNSWFTCSTLTRFPHATSGHLDMNWIIPGEMLALKDPTINREKEYRKVSKQIMRELKRCGIRVVVRLNSNDHNTNIEYYGKSYNPNDFVKEKFFHYEIPFKDVGVPTTAQANKFVALCERYEGKIAVHCHAGLGRTATMIGCYLIKHFGFDSRAACGWLKLCRRGSIMGPQHFFLDKYAVDLQNVKNQSECFKPYVEKISRETTSSPSALSSQSTTISRPPCKNNIIHAPPVNMRQRNNNSMKKYMFDVGVKSVGNIRNKTTVKELQAQKLIQTKSSRTVQKTTPIKITKPTISSRPPSKSSTTIQKKTLRECSSRPKRARKQSTSRLCYSKSVDRPSQTKIPHIKSQASNRCMKETLKRTAVESRERKPYGDSHHAAVSYPKDGDSHHAAAVSYPKDGDSHHAAAVSYPKDGDSHHAAVSYPKDWGQWSGKIIEGLVSRSKNRLYGLINNVCTGQDLHCQEMIC